jgi:hypothetical protein
MTGGGDLDEIEDEDSDVMDDDDTGDLDVPDVGADESDGTDDDESGASPGPDLSLNENDPDPTAGASDVGGVPGGIEPDGPTGS